MPECAKCGATVYVPDGMEFEKGDLCGTCLEKSVLDALADRDHLRDQFNDYKEQLWCALGQPLKSLSANSYASHDSRMAKRSTSKPLPPLKHRNRSNSERRASSGLEAFLRVCT